MKLNWKRWLIVVYLLSLMAFTTSVLLIPGEKYNTLTTSDSGWVYDIAAEIDNKNGFIDNNPLSHAPYGHPVGLSEQGQPLLAVMLYRTVHAVNSDVTLMDVVNYFGPLIFALTLIPVFLIGRELGGDLAGCAATFFFATLGSVSAWMGSPIYWCKFGAFDREPTQLILGVWAVYLAIRLYKAPTRSIPMFAALEGLVCGLALLTWPGMFYLVPIVVGSLLLCLLLGFFGKLIKGKKISEAASLTGDENSRLVVGVIGAMAVAALALYALGVADHQFWIGNIQAILSYVPISAGTMAILVAAAGVFFAYFFLRAREKTWGYAALAVVVLVCALGIYSLKTIPSGAGLPAPSERYAGEMRAPESWSGIIYGFYGEDILTKFVFFLVALAIVKVCLSRKRWELLVFPWLIILMGLVWPGVGMVRFERMWWPFVAVVAGLGAATLVSAIKWLSREPMTAEWAGLFKKPVVIALCFSLIPIPFVTNAYATARVTAAPTGPGLDDGFMDAFAWIRENTPEDSIFAIEWSYGHLFTGTARRATVCDGCETAGVLGEWENTATTRPPDYIKDSAGNLLNSHWTINGRRTDVQYLPTLTADNELEFYLKTYRDNYGVRIDYVIFHAGQHDDAIFATRRGGLQDMTSPASMQDENILYTFGDQNVFLNLQQMRAYMVVEGETLSLAGIVFLYFDAKGNYRGYSYTFTGAPAIPRALWVYIVEGTTWDRTIAKLTAPTVYGWPIIMRVFEGRGTIPDFMSDIYTSRNRAVKVIKINHVSSLTSPVNGVKTRSSTLELAWSGAVGAAKYKLEVDDDADFSSPVVQENDLIGRSYTTPPLADDNYSWRVGAYGGIGNFLGWSDVFTFVVDTTAPDAPILSAPENGSETGDSTPTFEWSRSTDALNYRLLVDNDSTFDAPEIDIQTAENTYIPTVELPSDTYYWHVIAIDAAGNENTSPTWLFTITAGGT